MKFRLGLLIGALLLALPALSLACSNLGPNTHAGIVKGIDLEEKTLTLIDAESGKPITFTASPSFLSPLEINNRVIVTFRSEERGLVVEEIRT